MRIRIFMKSKCEYEDEAYICPLRHLIGQLLLYNVEYWFIEFKWRKQWRLILKS